MRLESNFMAERITKWEPVLDIDSSFRSIAYSFQDDCLSVRMVGARTLTLRFTGVVALHFEQECPGFDFLSCPLPMLRPSETFPLLIVEESAWAKKYNLIYKDIAHFALISSDHLLQLIAERINKAHWEH